MKIFSLLLALWIACVLIGTVAADPVDLSGKQGVVDPKGLKKDDPKSPKVEGKAPPPPSSDSSSSTTPPVIGGSATGSAGSGGRVNAPITKL
jgi:hypothetical protein